MKMNLKIWLVFFLISFVLSAKFRTYNNKRHHSKVLQDEKCDEHQKTSKCDTGLKCFPIVTKVSQNVRVDWKCKEESYKVPAGGLCIYQTFGSHCERDSKTYASCKDTHIYVDYHGKKSKIGTCTVKGRNPHLPASALTRSQSIKTTPILDLPKAISLDEDEITFINDAFDEIQGLVEGKDSFAAGYIILQYFIDEDEIKDENIKTKILKPYLEYMRSQGRTCEDVEEELDLKGIHVVNTWTSAERNKYLWMVNNNYIKGLQGGYDKALTIRGLADATGNTASKIIGEFASNAEIAGGFIKVMVDLAIKTIVNKQLTNALLAASSSHSSGDGSSPVKAKAIFIKSGDTIEIGEGFGMIPRNSICKELRVDTGLKYMTGAHKAP